MRCRLRQVIPPEDIDADALPIGADLLGYAMRERDHAGGASSAARHWFGLACNRQSHESRDDAKRACRDERRQVTCELSPGQPGAEGRASSTELMPGIDPAEHEIGALRPDIKPADNPR